MARDRKVPDLVDLIGGAEGSRMDWFEELAAAPRRSAQPSWRAVEEAEDPLWGRTPTTLVGPHSLRRTRAK